ncbi:unnamed protein product [Cuscuta epithymum]|uniref:DUF4283 domain-containing protein n=1 Tax=Cuscuta epithymum TaxID=186058 RepID=A0AAV0D3J6_9ASTE|nr:unnamed protein product [Cuscuta epithymum]
MARKKMESGESSSVRTTRSSSRFFVLEDNADEFPALISGDLRPQTPATKVVESIATKGTAGKSLNTVKLVTPIAGTTGAGQLTVITMAETSNEGLKNPGKAVKNQKTGAGQIQQAPEEADMGNKPWNALFKDNRAPSHGIKLRYIPPKGNILDLTDRVMPTMVEMWGHCLVGFFTGRFPGLKAVHELREKWGVKCLVRSHDKGWIIFKFQNEADRLKVLNEGPYSIFGKLLMLKMLSEDFSFEDEEFLKVPIWVKFPNLPMSLWNEGVMSEVASMIGVPLSTDKVTQERTNHNYARVLIEVDVSKPPPLSFPIRLPSHKVIKQWVRYETFPNYCFHCKEYGHHPFICKKLAEKEMKEKNDKEKNDIVVVREDELKIQGEEVGVKEMEGQGKSIVTVLEPAIMAEEKIMPEAAVLEETESESSGYGSFETDNGSGEEDLDQTDTANFDEVYMDGKVFMIRKDANVNRNRMTRRIPGLSWEETFAKNKMALPNLFKSKKKRKKRLTGRK